METNYKNLDENSGREINSGTSDFKWV